MAAATLRLLHDSRLRWLFAGALLASFAGGLVHGALAARLGGMDAIELQTAAVSRGAATPLAVVLLVLIAVAGRYRDGSWLHEALAEPRPTRRLLVSAAPVLAACGAIALSCGAAAAAGSGAAGRIEPGLALVAVGLHLVVSGIWALWMLGVAHATRSTMLTLAIGAGLPVVVEPAIAGLLAQGDLGALRWLLPGQALRAIAELPATGGVLLQPVPPAVLPAALGTIVACTAAIGMAAWLRERGPQPR
ncbi:hypothetical protein [Agrococcus sp. Ld7]|uniref:hypothetical protein n=1 Tax=Agrococcus sp. Ld7 TaxID=649148 RepID=UPI00386F931F